MPAKLVDRYPLVNQLMDEGRVGTVFQQAPYEIGQQILVCPDGSVDPAIATLRRLFQYLFVECLAHAMQALELQRAITSHIQQAGYRVCVMGGELREQVALYRLRQQIPGAGEVGEIGIG